MAFAPPPAELGEEARTGISSNAGAGRKESLPTTVRFAYSFPEITIMSTFNRNISVAIFLVGLLGSMVTTAAPRPSIADLQAQIAALQANNVPNLADYLTVYFANRSTPTLLVAGANLQITNGLGSTASVNGLGNLIVGYDEVRTSGSPVCSIGYINDQAACETNGGTWSISHKSGSHNVVVGRWHDYSQYAGLVAGGNNTINSAEATVSGGYNNTASGAAASVSGGLNNTASSADASVSGGYRNTASGSLATVSGGANRTASGNSDWVAGGLFQDQ